MLLRARLAERIVGSIAALWLVTYLFAGTASAQKVFILVGYHSQVPPGTAGYPGNWPFFEPGNPAMANGYCTVACIDMLFNYFNDPAAHNAPPNPQLEIAAVANTNDPRGGGGWVGTKENDARRAVHFSSVTPQWPNAPPAYVGNQGVNSPRGYSWRAAAPMMGTKYGWVGIDGNWGTNGWTINQLYQLLNMQVPLIVHLDPDSLLAYAQVDSSDSDFPWDQPDKTCQPTTVGHSVVLTGYDNARNVFTFRDPTRGPAWMLNQQKFWNAVWAGKKFLYVHPWRSAIQIPVLGSWVPSNFVTTGTAHYCDDLPAVGTGTQVQTSGWLSFPGANAVAALAAGQAATIAFNQVVTSGQQQQNTWQCVTQRRGTSTAVVETWGVLQNAVAHSSGAYVDRIGAVESTAVTVPPLVAWVDPSICLIPRGPRWWHGYHFYLPGPPDYAPGMPRPIQVGVENRGDLTATGTVLRLFWADPTTAEFYPDSDLHSIGTVTLPPIAPGDSLLSSPVTFTTPTGNSFGAPYYGFVAVVENAGDPRHDSWVEGENNIACRSYNRVQVSPGMAATVSFWIYNPQSTSAWVATRLASDKPPEWSAHLEPAGSDSMLLAAHQRVPKQLVVNTSTPWQSTFEVSSYVYGTDGRFVRCTGGATFFVSSAPVDVGPDREILPVTLSVRPSAPGAPIELSFTLPAPRSVDLSVFDVRGSFVVALYSGLAPAGTTVVSWDATDARRARVAAGVYMLRFDAGKEALTRKILVLH